MKTVIVVGGGIAGLTVAYELLERSEARVGDLEVICFESSDRPGGNVRTERSDGFLCEWGPTGFLDNSPATLTLVRRLGLQDRIVRAREEAARRYILRKGKLRTVPLSPPAFLRSDVLSPGGRLRVLAEPLIPRLRDGRDETVFDFAKRRIGGQAAEILIDAMVSGVYAGNSRRLSLESTFPRLRKLEAEHGGLFRGMLAQRKKTDGESGGGPAGPGGRLTSFRNGMQELTDALAEALGPRLRIGQRIRAVSDMGMRGFRIHPEQGAPLDADAVVMATPCWSTTPVVEKMDREMTEAIAGIKGAPVAVVHFGYSRDALGDIPEGFGFLVPRGQGPRILGTLWPATIFDGRAPDGRVLMTTMVGGAHEPGLAKRKDDGLVELVRGDLQMALGIIARPYFTNVMRHPHGIPQYDVGHRDRMEVIERRLREHEGLWLAGNSYRGVSINACVEEAPKVAEQVLEHLARRTEGAAT